MYAYKSMAWHQNTKSWMLINLEIWYCTFESVFSGVIKHEFILQLNGNLNKTPTVLPNSVVCSIVHQKPYHIFSVHCKKVYRFSRHWPGCHKPNSPWPGIIKLFPARESLVGDIPVRDGKNDNLFLQCSVAEYTGSGKPEATESEAALPYILRGEGSSGPLLNHSRLSGEVSFFHIPPSVLFPPS